MILLDTCALVFDALASPQLTARAKKAISIAEKQEKLFCCDISLWEVAMLVQKKRLTVDADPSFFLENALAARKIQVLPITTPIAILSTNPVLFSHHNPADRIIAASALYHQATLITPDKKLQQIANLSCLW